MQALWQSVRVAGYYAGWIASAFTIGQLVTNYFWGSFADRFGRKPVFIIGMVSMIVCSVGFGVSTSFVSALIWRLFLGLTLGVWSLSRVVIPELMRPEDVVVGMGCLPGAMGLGLLFGPACAGMLAQPAERYPETFSATGLFGRFPFLLPNLFLAFLSLLSLPFIVFHLPETLVPSDEERAYTASRSLTIDSTEMERSSMMDTSKLIRSSAVLRSRPMLAAEANGHTDMVQEGIECSSRASGGYNSSSDEEEPSYLEGISSLLSLESDVSERYEQRRGCKSFGCHILGRRFKSSAVGRFAFGLWGSGGLLSSWYLRLILIMEFLDASHRMGFDTVYPIWMLTPLGVGGLGWSLGKIGKVLGWTGIGMVVYQFHLYPVLCRTVGMARLLAIAGVLGPLLFLTMPDIQRLGWNEMQSSILGVGLLMMLNFGTSVWTIALSLVAANAVPSHKRGQYCGLLGVAEAFGRAVGPAMFGSLFAWSLQTSSPLPEDDDGLTSTPASNHGLVDYHFVFILDAVLMAVMVFIGWATLTLEKLTIPTEEWEQVITECEDDQEAVNEKPARATDDGWS